MPQAVEWFVGTGGDYANWDAWKSARSLPLNLTTLDEEWFVTYLPGAFNDRPHMTAAELVTDTTRRLNIRGHPDYYHRGRVGIGPRLYVTSDIPVGEDIIGMFGVSCTVEMLEIAYFGAATHGTNHSSSACKLNNPGARARKNLIWRINISDRNRGLSSLNNAGVEFSANMIFGIGRGPGAYQADVRDASGIRLEATGDGWVQGNSIWDVEGWGIELTAWVAAADIRSRNNLSFGSEVVDYKFVDAIAGGGSGSITHEYNMSGDATADDRGSNNLINRVAAEQFINLVAGNEDLHLRATSEAIRAGVNLGAGFFSEDIHGRLRPSLGPWDMGADQVHPYARRSLHRRAGR